MMSHRTAAGRRPIPGRALPCLLALALAGCGGDVAELPIPDFVSPEGRQVLLDARADLAACQDAQVTIAFSEIISLSNPAAYAASMAGQSAGQGQADLPADNSLQGVMAIERICCENIEKRIELHAVNYIVPEQSAGRLSNEEFQFWRKLSAFVGSGQGGCRLPDQRDPGLGWPSG